MTGGNCSSASRHRRQRLFYEACIPALLLALLACRYGVPPNSNSTVLCAAALMLSLSSLVLRLVWSSEDNTQPHVYRPGADDGAVWGSLLVPISVLATSIGAVEASTDPIPGAIRLHTAIVLSLGMSVTFTAHYQWSRIRKTALYIEASCFIWALWLACTIAVGYAGKAAFGDTFGLAQSIAVLLIASIAQHAWRNEILRSLPRSFTMGEAAVFAQGLALVAVDFAIQMGYRLQTDAPDSAYWESHMHVLCLEAVVLGLWMAGSVLARVMATGVLGKRARRGVPGLMVLGSVFGGFGVLALALVSYISQIHPIRWILATTFGSPAHIAILTYWVALLAMAGAVYAVAQGDVSESTKFMLHVKRKSYHVLAALMFVPGLVYARPLLYMGFVVAAAGFVVAECMRALDLGPCSTSIDAFMRRFIDYRDAGPVVTAHFYLLLGCALPVWLGHGSVSNLAGVLSLGVADTAASLVGMKLGRMRWPGTAKTVEGTVGFCLSLLAAIGVVLWLLKGDVGVGWYWYALVSVVVGVLEALTEQNDNLVVPLCMYALMQALP
ncbi:dolichol kinase [Coemansia sp. S146]|nr:dolichol kinase [Coemansia sp. S146]